MPLSARQLAPRHADDRGRLGLAGIGRKRLSGEIERFEPCFPLHRFLSLRDQAPVYVHRPILVAARQRGIKAQTTVRRQRLRKLGMPQSGNQRSSSGSIFSSPSMIARTCSSRSPSRAFLPAGTNGYQ